MIVAHLQCANAQRLATRGCAWLATGYHLFAPSAQKIEFANSLSLFCAHCDFASLPEIKFLQRRKIFQEKSMKRVVKISRIQIVVAIVAALVFNTVATLAQNQQGTDMQFDAAMRTAVIEGVLKNLNDAYVFPETAKKMEQAIRERMARKEYDAITSPAQLVSTLTTHLREVSKDKHLRVVYNPRGFPARANPGKEDLEKERAARSLQNFSFQKVERLEGNVGYIDLRGFEDANWAGDTAAAAMSFLANTDALIFDMRNNGGGQPEMVQLLCSYLFNSRTHLNDIYQRPTNKTTEYWTLDKVAGKKYGQQKEVYVLTSRRTFSAAEEFTYNLKNLKRATIVGETTGGGAHPVDFYRINDNFGIGVPTGRAINPITKTNWEGTGVAPDIEIPADQALKAAQLDALKKISARVNDPQRVDRMKGLIASLQRELDEKAAGNSKPAMQMSSELNTSQPKAAAPSTDEVKLPETPAGKTLHAFLQAFNTGSLEALKKFHSEHGGNAENANEDLNFFNQCGGLKVHSVNAASDYSIQVLTQAKNDGRWLNFTIQVGANPPHSIDDIRVQPASAPTGNEKPATSVNNSSAKINPAPAKKLTEAEALTEIEAFLAQQAAEDNLSGTVLIARDGKPIFKKAYGLADKNANTPNKTDTKFNLGSMNKMFTSVAVAQLAEKGKLSFDDKVGKYLPDYPNKDVREKVSIHQLLTHTAGLGSFWNKKFDEKKAGIKTVADYLALFADEPLLFEPGARFQYSNSGFIVLGAIIEKVSGQNYYDYVRQNIYKPAGMTNSDAYEMTETVANMAHGYTSEGQNQAAKTRKENIDSRPNRGGPAGGGYSTAEDLLKFVVALRENKLISAKSLELITTGKVKMGGNLYAYGFGDIRVNGKRSFGHNGGAPGIASSLSIFPELGYTVIVMTNYDPPNMMPVVRKLEETVTYLN
jgi:CubicO group peptidase (beta-lactamase class C family)